MNLKSGITLGIALIMGGVAQSPAHAAKTVRRRPASSGFNVELRPGASGALVTFNTTHGAVFYKPVKFGESVALGSAIDGADQSIKATCLLPGKTERLLPSAVIGKSDVFDFKNEIKTQDELNQILMPMKWNGTDFGIYSQDPRAKFATEFKLNPESFYFGGSIQVGSSNNDVLKDTKFTAEAQALCHKSRDEFKKLCGDGFVASTGTGGEINFFVEIETASPEDREEVAGIARSASLGVASTQEAFKNISKTHKVTAFIFRSGVTGEPHFSDLAEVMVYYRAFPTKVAVEPASQAQLIRVGGLLYDKSIDTLCD